MTHFKALLLALTTLVAFALLVASSPFARPDLLNDADIIFHTSKSNQSNAILATTNSRFSHMGLIEKVDGKYYVIESVSTVKRTPLAKWKARGRDSQFAVYRFSDLTDAQRKKIIAKAHTLEGLPYDVHFSAINDGKKQYCSRLVFDSFKAAGLELGKWQKVRELATDNPELKIIFKQRFKTHPLCLGKINFEQCWVKVLDDSLITPESISKDTRIVLIDANYP